MSIFGIFKKNDSNEEINQSYVEDKEIPNDEDGLDLTDDVQEDGTPTEKHDDEVTPSTPTDSNNDVDDSDPEVDKISGHNNNDVRYFMDKDTDLSKVADHLIQRFQNAGYDVTIDHKADGDDQYYRIEATKTESSAPILIEVNNELAGAVRNIDDHIESTAFDPTNDDEITNILQVWSN